MSLEYLQKLQHNQSDTKYHDDKISKRGNDLVLLSRQSIIKCHGD
jgi:hypothetical protein